MGLSQYFDSSYSISNVINSALNHVSPTSPLYGIASSIPNLSIPNSGYSAVFELAKDGVDKVKSGDSDIISKVTDSFSGSSDSSGSSGSYGSYFTPSASYVSPATVQELEYIDAPYAEMYGMDASTAYHEALANTAYQRKVKDLKAAGLNPVLGISGSGSESFYGTPLSVQNSGYSVYGASGSGSSSDFSLASKAKSLQYWLPSLAAGVAGLTVGLTTKSPGAGVAAGSIVSNTVNGILGGIRNSG